MNTGVVEIITRTEGNTSRFRTERACVREEGGDYRVTYTQEGDAVSITANERCLIMQRKGAASLRMRFVRREATLLILEEEGGGGEVPLYTAEYSFARGKRGFSARLSYDLLFSASNQHFYVTIKSEEK